MIKLVIYDLDGTLIDSKRDIAAATNYALAQLKFPELSVDDICRYVGYGLEQLLESALGKVSRTHADLSSEDMRRAVEFYKDYYSKHLLDETILYPGVGEVLDKFSKHGIAQAVLTNKSEVFAHQILRAFGVDHYFFEVAGGDRWETRKPAADPVIKVMELAKSKTDETVLVGDSDIDIEAGRNAGVKTIAMTYGFQPAGQIQKSQPDFILDRFSDLLLCPIFGCAE